MAAFENLELGELLAICPRPDSTDRNRMRYVLRRLGTGYELELSACYFPTIQNKVANIGGTQYYREINCLAGAVTALCANDVSEPRYAGVAIRDRHEYKPVKGLWFVFDDYYFTRRPARYFVPGRVQPKRFSVHDLLHLLFDPNVRVDEGHFRVVFLLEVRPLIAASGQQPLNFPPRA